MKKVIQHKPKGLRIEIEKLEGQFEIPNVKKMQEELLHMFNNPKDYTCLSQDDIDKIFGPWVNLSPKDKAHATAKRTFIKIKETMFVDDDSNCPEFDNAEDF